MRLLTLLAALGVLLAAGGCSGKEDDGKNNPAAKRLTDAEFESRRTKKGGDEPGH